MELVDQVRAWDEASSPAAARCVRTFEEAWRASPNEPPDPGRFLPDDPSRRPGILLALLRADLALRRGSGHQLSIERYCKNRPELSDDVLVALAYEDFCLREDAGEHPAACEYENWFPSVAPRLRELFDIHELLGSARSLLPGSLDAETTMQPFPESGETISGFRLVEELGRGSFGRVFLAGERPLADRLVALKVTRVGSREPQALARLQHTNIVPVHSYRVDPTTSLHLLCMPYFGRVTLARVIAEVRARAIDTGAELAGLLDELQTDDEGAPPCVEIKRKIEGLSLARAVASWGARLAEALQHAHDQGILHRDVKPSNILITSAAVPMLLDFNLSQPARIHDDDLGRDTLGGTVAYMAPEHIAALAGRDDGPIDGRADTYSLGLVLFELLAHRPFAGPADGQYELDSLIDIIEQRRAWVPRTRPGERAIPAPMEAVLRRCLAADPADRYATAGEFAVDLQAGADDGALRFAREPQPSRAVRWTRRNKRGLILGAVVGVIVIGALFGAFLTHTDLLRREALARQKIGEGLAHEHGLNFLEADGKYALAEDWASRSPWLRDLGAQASSLRKNAQARYHAQRLADDFHAKVEPLESRLIQRRDLKEVNTALLEALEPFGVLDDSPVPWSQRLLVELLDEQRRAQLIADVNDLLFLWVVAADRPNDPQRARRSRAICDRALTFAEPKGPWEWLRARYDSASHSSPPFPTDPRAEESSRACFQWGLLAPLAGQRMLSPSWLERACKLEPGEFWFQFTAGNSFASLGSAEGALRYYNAAIAIRPHSAWALFNRAQVYWSRLGAWERARHDLAQAEKYAEGFDLAFLRAERGRMAQRLGDFPAALAAYSAVIESDPSSALARNARLNRAQIEAEQGDLHQARTDYEAVLAESPDSLEARLGLAVLARARGDFTLAETLITTFLATITEPGWRAQLLAERALVRYSLRKSADAAADAAEAFRLEPTVRRRRLVQRLTIARSSASEIASLDVDDFDRWPAQGPRLRDDLIASLDRLAAEASGSQPPAAYSARRARALLLSGLKRHAEALAEVDRLLIVSPLDPETHLLRALVQRRAGQLTAALGEVERGLDLVRDSPRLRAWRGRLCIELGQPIEGLIDLDRAILADGGQAAHVGRAEALMALGRLEEALREWALVVDDDPDNADAYLARAGCFLSLGNWDQALANLESAALYSGERPRMLARLACAYSLCLRQHPNRAPRVAHFLQRAAIAWLQTEAEAAAR